MKLVIDTEAIKALGYSSAKIELILREGKETYFESVVGDPISFPDSLSPYLPIGNPPSYLAAYAYVDNTPYLTFFKTRDVAVHVTMSSSGGKFTHPLYLFDSLNEQADAILALTQTNGAEEEFSLSLSATGLDATRVDELKALDGLDSLIYSLFIRRNILVLGDASKMIRILQSILNLMPPEYRKYFGFSFNNLHVHDTITFYYLSSSMADFDSLSQQFIDMGGDILDLDEGAFYGEFTTNLAQNLVNEIEDQDTFHASVRSLQAMVADLEPNISLDEMVTTLDIGYNDAEFLKGIQNSFFARRNA